jgi:hypothetical protein
MKKSIRRTLSALQRTFNWNTAKLLQSTSLPSRHIFSPSFTYSTMGKVTQHEESFTHRHRLMSTTSSNEKSKYNDSGEEKGSGKAKRDYSSRRYVMLVGGSLTIVAAGRALFDIIKSEALKEAVKEFFIKPTFTWSKRTSGWQPYKDLNEGTYTPNNYTNDSGFVTRQSVETKLNEKLNVDQSNNGVVQLALVGPEGSGKTELAMYNSYDLYLSRLLP